MNWKEANLGELITFQRGFDITKKELTPGKYDVIFSSGFGGKHSDFKVKAPGVVIGRKGTLGTVFFATQDFWPTDTTLWVKDFHGNHEKFAYYFLQTLHLEQYDCGAANPTLNRNHIHTIPVRFPPLPIQRKIAAILSTYDDLIENNTRRIKILEEMARSLYREWFVNFRFPGHEQVKMVDSELGLIPEGWEVKNFGEVSLNFDKKRKPLSSLQRAKIQGKYPYYGAAKIFDYINNYIFEGRYLLVAEDGSVITKDRHPVLQLVDEKFWANNHTHVIQGKEPISTNYLYLFMSDLDISGYITGAAQPKINQTNLNRIPVIVPREILLKQFNNIIDSLLT
ncbi:restriction endonuclease subunit S [Planktothrix pseudagardhii]|uniref:Type I restriction enzyme specificity protein HI_0216 n=1 Tax=Planktothrix pseudagardhii TaxID=132604 RepID=A0A9W4G740_9CYAN|nr:restriction endonuclease subunit S [Planktothrix pseudagardhii]CAD5955212.1 Putative type I restriction enzyme specificity protein HI_0216 [Planktothrix pseudagardhii]